MSFVGSDPHIPIYLAIGAVLLVLAIARRLPVIGTIVSMLGWPGPFDQYHASNAQPHWITETMVTGKEPFEAEQPEEQVPVQSAPQPAAAPARASAKKGRASMPSWD